MELQLRFVSHTKNGAKCFFNQKDNVCINKHECRTVPLFRFVKHLLATNVDCKEFLSQSSA